jgi:CheY-like chemotaxis protein
MHGGRIWVESEGLESRGSTFTFLIPVPKSEAKPAPLADQPDSPCGIVGTATPLEAGRIIPQGERDDTIRPLVLIVTDDAASQQVAGDYLTGVGYDVAVIPQMEAIIGTVKAKWFYAVVIDRKLVDQHGEQELLKSRSKIPPRIPLVIFSVDDDGRPGFSLFGSPCGIVRTATAHSPCGIIRPASSGVAVPTISQGEAGGIIPQGKERAVPERLSSRLAVWNNTASLLPRTGANYSTRLVDAIRRSDKTTGKELKTVLIIDDELALLELLTKTLLQEGFRVLRASNGRKGVEFATSYHPDVIILDFTMPEFDGSKVVEQLRAHPRTKDIPILIQTGTILNEEERQRLAGHVQAITSKTERGSLLAELERLDAVSAEAVMIGANP